MICNTDHEILRNTERIAIIWLKFHWFLVITIKWTIKILEFQINSLIIFDKNNMEKHWIREEENDPFHSPERCFFSQTPFLKTIKEPPDYYAAAYRFPKREKITLHNRKIISWYSPGTGAQKIFQRNDIHGQIQPARTKHFQVYGYQRQWNDICSDRPGRLSIAKRPTWIYPFDVSGLGSWRSYRSVLVHHIFPGPVPAG